MATMTLQEMQAKYQGDLQQVPRADYSVHGDFLGVVLRSGGYTLDRVDEVLTLHRSMETNEVIGFTLKGMSVIARQILEESGITEEDVDLRLVVLAAAKVSTHLSIRYACLFDFPITIPRETLKTASVVGI